jgi:SAM-dependent methyltransferase
MSDTEICEVCGSRNLVSVLDLGNHPLCDDLVPFGSNRICKEYPIEITYCNVCYTAFQRFEVSKHDLFTDTYHYRARMTGSVLKGMSDLVDSCEARFGDLQGKLVLDVGCNDGSLLNFFEEKGCRTIGVEPTGAARDSRHETLNMFFDEKSATLVKEKHGYPDIITFTNVFAHIENLPELIGNVKSLMGERTVVVVENHYLGAILKTDQFDTFYHEHPRTYSHRSFEFIAESLGVSLLNTEYVSRYGGNIRAYMGPGAGMPSTKDEEKIFSALFENMQQSIIEWKSETRKWIKEYAAEQGAIRAKAFPGRAAILIKLLGLDENHVSAVYEITGSIKVGHYVPGTRIPILPEAELYELENQNAPILNLAWHLPSEVRANLAKNGYTGKVFDIKSGVTD